MLAAAGLVGLFLFFVFWARGRWHTWFQTGSPAGGIYAETFAVWLLLYWGLDWLVGQFRAAEYRVVVHALPGPISLLALGWPVLRGYSWRQVRHELGLTAGPRPCLEPWFGLVAYAMALPLLVVGVLVMLLIMRLQNALRGTGGLGTPLDPGDMPSHPIVDTLLRMNGWERAQLFVLACVIAPLVEETMFRGVLYRHLREATARLSLPVSALVSATVASFLFAVIHPQGFLAVPALMGLAYGFSLAREWRGTLVPGMMAHGLNNGIVFAFFLVSMSP